MFAVLALSFAVTAACTVDAKPDTAIDASTSTGIDAEVNDCPRARVTTNGGDLNIREQPDTSTDNVIGSLANGAVVPVLDRVQGETVLDTSEWFEIDDDGTIGFISGAFAACTTDPAFSPPPSAESASLGSVG